MKKKKTTTAQAAGKGFEKDMKQLEDIVRQMGQGGQSLEESIKLFETGIELSKKCSKELNQAEQRVQKIINSNTTNDVEVEKFDVQFENEN